MEDTGEAPSPHPGRDTREQPQRVGVQLEQWVTSEEATTLGSLVELFGQKSFALVFVVLLGVPALPLPTGGATHVFEIVCVLLALQLVLGRETVWLPKRWQGVELGGKGWGRFLARLIKVIKAIERLSKPRLRWLFGRRATDIAFGLVIVVFAVAAFVAPPFTGLDTLPALGGVLISLAVLLEDVVLALVAILTGAAGIVLEIVLGTAAVNGISSLL
jgi:hypothetical protein